MDFSTAGVINFRIVQILPEDVMAPRFAYNALPHGADVFNFYMSPPHVCDGPTSAIHVVTSPDQYGQLQAALAHGGFTLAERQSLAAAAFVHTATYDIAVASWMGNVLTDTSDGEGFPAWAGGTWEKVWR